MPKKKEIVGQVGFYSFAFMLTQGVTIIASIITKRFLGPVQVGIWSVVQIILSYSEHASMGANIAVAQRIPFYRGKSDEQSAESLKDTVFSFSLIMSAVVAASVAVYAFTMRESLGPTMFYGLIFGAALVILQCLNNLLISLLRAYKEFEVAGAQMFWSSVINALLIALLSYRFKLYGFMSAMALSFLFNIFYIQRRRPFHFCWSMSRAKVIDLIAYGFPFMLITFLGVIFSSIDKIVISRFLGFEALGFYSIASMTQGFIHSFPNTVGIVIIPNVSEKFGQRENRHDLKGYLVQSDYVFCTVMPVLIGTAFFLIPCVVHLILPKFIPGIGALHRLILGAYFLGVTIQYSNFLVVLQKRLLMGLIAGLSIALTVFFDVLVLRWGWGIDGIAAATSLALAMNFTLNYFLAGRLVYERTHLMRHYAGVMLKFGFFVSALYAIQRFVRIEAEFVTVVLQLGALYLIYSPFLYALERRYGVLSLLRERVLRQSKNATEGSA